jgi:hypothetical protein
VRSIFQPTFGPCGVIYGCDDFTQIYSAETKRCNVICPKGLAFGEPLSWWRSIFVADLMKTPRLGRYAVDHTERLKKSSPAVAHQIHMVRSVHERGTNGHGLVGYISTIDHGFDFAQQGQHLRKQEKVQTICSGPSLPLKTSSLRPYGNGCSYVDRNNCDARDNGLRPHRGPLVGFKPHKDRLRKLKSFEHSRNLPRLPSFVERLAH